MTSLSVAFCTVYGRTFTFSLALGIAVIAWGFLVVDPLDKHISQLGATLVDGKATADYTASLRCINPLGAIELLGCLALLTCMILKRFGP